MRLSFVLVATAILSSLNSAQAANSVTFQICRSVVGFRGTFEYGFSLTVRDKYHGAFSEKKVMLPFIDDTTCSDDKVFCVKHDRGIKEVSVQYAGEWHHYKKKKAAKNYEDNNGAWKCQEYWDEYHL
ncbi:hypothetical protein BKA57DRAFT_455649 [Linnemannia elongata]|nr:hypothetical protein BKA57DRAFT_455649 [Linnemannia elongata]